MCKSTNFDLCGKSSSASFIGKAVPVCHTLYPPVFKIKLCFLHKFFAEIPLSKICGNGSRRLQNALISVILDRGIRQRHQNNGIGAAVWTRAAGCPENTVSCCQGCPVTAEQPEGARRCQNPGILVDFSDFSRILRENLLKMFLTFSSTAT